ncbi:hypothetical protein A2628_06050 [Candidatus Woesebacteria bacterium RIFCSPHIGHO2_01_FULL_40_22]|uniref:Uncharacterized protein n=1 Tax=Candidatus Woesebacteria bacterium RIFCSPHIGHO2_01_FULL_40_22 TaxID=1802499 RepID=A0A1F7YI14_9BACT|nr:MAG: hypothetical protein A2628_06050 [Candidatus Woesebacteria bacterium RIFCSPHIGHO2_01_FULL_40_22]
MELACGNINYLPGIEVINMAKEEAENGDEEAKKMGAMIIPGGFLLGFGIGLLTGNIAAWMFIGLGAGFMSWAAVSFIRK